MRCRIYGMNDMTGYSYASGVCTATTTLRCPECLTVRVVPCNTKSWDDVICCCKKCLTEYKAKVRVVNEMYARYVKLKSGKDIKRGGNGMVLLNGTAAMVSEKEIPYPRKGKI